MAGYKDRRQMTEDRRLKTDDRRQMTEAGRFKFPS